MSLATAWIVRHRSELAGLAVAAGAAALAHAAWSPAGWNAALDGTLLAAARRLLEGQVPYRDFIWADGPLAPCLQIPLLALAGDALFLKARALVWIQLAAVAWLWARMADRELNRPLGAAGIPLMTALAFGGVGFPWAATDGAAVHALLLSSLGIALRLGARAGPDGAAVRRAAGYSLLGLAVLCKLSFWLVPPAVILATGDGRRLGAWLAAAWPAILGLGLLAGSGSLYDAWIQIYSCAEPWPRVWQALLQYSFGALCAFFALRWVEGTPPLSVPTRARGPQRLAGLVLWGFTALVTARVTRATYDLYAGTLVFWMLIGAWLYVRLERGPEARREAAFGFLAGCLALASWTPIPWPRLALSSGLTAVPLLAWAWRRMPHPRRRAAGFALTAAAYLALSLAVQRARPERDPPWSWTQAGPDAPARELVHPLDGVLAGGAGLHTSSNVLAVLRDLGAAVARAEAAGRPYAILPDMPGHWPRATQANPLPLDWVAGPRPDNRQIHDSVIEALEARRGNLVIIVQKFQGRRLWYRRWNQGNWPPPVAYVRRYFKRVATTDCFELYE